MADTTQLTPDEIQQYREKFKNDPKVLDTLDIIQEECDGNLQDAIILISMRETGTELEALVSSNWRLESLQYKRFNKAGEFGVSPPKLTLFQ
jgi:hypothetical protein